MSSHSMPFIHMKKATLPPLLSRTQDQSWPEETLEVCVEKNTNTYTNRILFVSK